MIKKKAILDKWERQDDGIRKQIESIEKTENAITEEEVWKLFIRTYNGIVRELQAEEKLSAEPKK